MSAAHLNLLSNRLPPLHRQLDMLLGTGTLLFLLATWKLWLPHSLFPRVPFISWAPPPVTDGLAWVCTGIGCLGLIAVPRRRRSAAGLLTCGLGLFFLGDQLRLQPWAWQFWLVSLLLAFGSLTTFVTGWRTLVVSIYVYSALSKCDAAFLTGSGWELLAPVRAWLPLAEGQQFPWPLLLPLGELLVAGLLALPQTRSGGRIASYGLHLGLFFLLGPLGLQHSRGVLLWNAFFLIQNWLLFATPGPSIERMPETAQSQPCRGDRLAWGVLAVACIWPAGYPWGVCDAWIGWAVYAPPFERVTITVTIPPDVVLPPRWPASLFPTQSSDEFAALTAGEVVDVNHWALSTLHVPSYPAPRHRIAVALALSQVLGPDSVRVRIDRRLSRWQTRFPATPARLLTSRDDIEREAGTYWFSAIPK